MNITPGTMHSNYVRCMRDGELKIIKRDNGDGSVSYIPEDSSNGDYVEYLAWVALGNTATEEELPAHNI